MGKYLDMAREALDRTVPSKRGDDALSQSFSSPSEISEKSEKRSADSVIAAFQDSFPPGVDSIPFNQAAMDAIKAGYAVRVWLGVVNEWAWWVRGEVEREKLLAEGCKLPIYTLGELAVIVNMSDQDVKNMHTYKREFNDVIGPASRNGKQSK